MRNTDGLDVSKFSFTLEVVIIDPGSTEASVKDTFCRVLEENDLPGFFTLTTNDKKEEVLYRNEY